jgi:hypothetical protein
MQVAGLFILGFQYMNITALMKFYGSSNGSFPEKVPASLNTEYVLYIQRRMV